MSSLHTFQNVCASAPNYFSSTPAPYSLCVLQFLPVPELMAIRLTRQIANVGLPLKVKGTLENTMVHVLRALRQNHDLLLATMDVFVKEVSVDWKVRAVQFVHTFPPSFRYLLFPSA